MTLKEENHRLIKRNTELEARLHLLTDAFENVRHGLCIFDSDGRIAFCNRRYPEILGLSHEKILPGLVATDLIRMARDAGYYAPGRTIADIEAEFWQNLSCESATPGQIHRAGRTYVVHPGRTTQGNLVATFEDITAQLSAENALRESEGRLSAMLAAMPDCIKIFDAEGRLAYINPAGLSLLEAPDLETLRASGHVAVPPQYMAQCIDVHNRVLAGESVVWTYEILGMSGGKRDVEAHAVPFRTPDGGRAHLSITRDITKRKAVENALRQSEERLRLIQEASGLADFENDCNEVTVCSDRFFEQVGLPVGDNRISIWRWLDLIHPEDRDRVQEEMQNALVGADTFESEYRIVRRDNDEVRWIACRTKLLRDEKGKAYKTIGAHRDVTHRKQSELALQEREKRLRLVHDITGLAEFWATGDGLAHVSERLIEQLGLPPDTETLSFDELLQYVHPGDRQLLDEKVRTSLHSTDTFECDFRIIHGHTGQVRWIRSRTKMDRDPSGKVLRSIGAHLDVTDYKNAEEALRESEERFRLAAEAAGLGIWDYDPLTAQREWSDRLLEIFGFTRAVEPSLKAAAERVHPDDRQRFHDLLNEALSFEDSVKFQDTFRIIRASDNAERWVSLSCWKTRRLESQLVRVILTLRDITEEKTAEERIRWTASHDALTHLANRTLFQEKLEKTSCEARKFNGTVGLLLLDLDRFKEINDSLGHDAGDSFLQMFADRLRSVVRPTDIVARLGGDEFAIILTEMKEPHRMGQLAESIRQRLRDPMVYEGRIIDCHTSIGGAVFPQDGCNSMELMKSADMALYSAKNSGRSTIRMYEPKLRSEVERRATMIQLARDALRDHRVMPHYQPKIDLNRHRVIGFEALLRWRSAAGKICLPEQLEAAFEDQKVATALSDTMIDHVISDMRTWLDDGIDFGHVAVNASPADFRRQDFAERTLERLAQAAIPTSMFQLEVTETVFLGRGAEYVHASLAQLSAAGVTIALDDFGTGYASLRHLKQFPVDIIKIDRSFVSDMETDVGDDAIVRAVISLGSSLGITVIAEGIEEESQVERLLRYGCNLGQGFLFSRAQPANAIPTILASKLRQKIGSEPSGRINTATRRRAS